MIKIYNPIGMIKEHHNRPNVPKGWQLCDGKICWNIFSPFFLKKIPNLLEKKKKTHSYIMKVIR